MSNKNGLSNSTQALLALVVFVLIPVSAWFSIGAPTTHLALAVLGSAITAGIVMFIKEYLGDANPSIPTPPQTPPTSTATSKP